MEKRGYTTYYTQCDTVDELFCQACGALCKVTRSIHGPTQWAEAMAKSGHWHDTFRCPHADAPWHRRLVRLIDRCEVETSPRLAAMLRADVADILHTQGLEIPATLTAILDQFAAENASGLNADLPPEASDDENAELFGG